MTNTEKEGAGNPAARKTKKHDHSHYNPYFYVIFPFSFCMYALPHVISLPIVESELFPKLHPVYFYPCIFIWINEFTENKACPILIPRSMYSVADLTSHSFS